MPAMTALWLADVHSMCEDATPGLWHRLHNRHGQECIYGGDGHSLIAMLPQRCDECDKCNELLDAAHGTYIDEAQQAVNAVFIQNARSALPRAVEMLRAWAPVMYDLASGDVSRVNHIKLRDHARKAIGQ